MAFFGSCVSSVSWPTIRRWSIRRDRRAVGCRRARSPGCCRIPTADSAACGAEVVHGHHHSGIARPAEVGPGLVADHVVGDPLLGDDALQLVSVVGPFHRDGLAEVRLVVLPRGVGVGESGRQRRGEVAFVGGRAAPLLEGGLHARVVEVLGRVAHRPAQQRSFGPQEPALGGVHDRHGVRLREERVGEGGVDRRQHVLDSRAHARIGLVVARLREVGAAPRVLVGVHIHRDVGVRAQVLPRFARRLRVVGVAARGERELQVLGVGVDQSVGVDGGHGLLGDAMRLGLHAAHADRHAQLERVGELDPQADVALVGADVEVAQQRTAAGRGEGVERLHGLVDHRHIDVALAVVGHGEGSVLHLRVGDRTVGVGHAQHRGHADDPRQLVHGAFAARFRHDLEVVAVEVREGVLEQRVVEVVRRVVGRYVLALVGFHGRCIAAQLVAQQHVVVLRGVHLHVHHPFHHRREEDAHADIVALEVLVRRTVGFGVVLFEAAGAGHGRERRAHCGQPADPAEYPVCFHFGRGFRIVTSR